MARSEDDPSADLVALASYVEQRRPALLAAWRQAVQADPGVLAGKVLSRAEVNDHIPALLDSYQRALADVDDRSGDRRPRADLRPGASNASSAEAATAVGAQAHGLHRWQQGYDLREVARELGLLNECMCGELERYRQAHPDLSQKVMAVARQRWARACTVAFGESTARFFRLQQLEAAGHIEELEAALDDLLELERLRSQLWQQAAHDLRGNVGVVSNVTAGLALESLPAVTRERFLGLLQRNVSALNHLLEDVTCLARLQAGEEQRELGDFDAAALLQQLGQGLQGLADERGLSLQMHGPSALWVRGDAVKVRRIAQNLILNALAYTREGRIDLAWGFAEDGTGQRWRLTVSDSGPGLHLRRSAELSAALEQATALTGPTAAPAEAVSGPPRLGLPGPWAPPHTRSAPRRHGEGLGLSIVKRLCDLLDATVEVETEAGAGTQFRILLPVTYPPAAGQGAAASAFSRPPSSARPGPAAASRD